MKAWRRRPDGSSNVQWMLFAAMAVWGVNVSTVKALTVWFDPLSLAVVRMVVATATLSIVMIWRRSRLPSLNLAQLAGLIACGALMVYANQLMFAEGLLRSKATNGSLIMALSPLASSLMAAVVFKERLTAKRLVGVLLGFGGVAAVVLSHPGATLSQAGIGDLLLVASVISFAIGGVLVQRLARGLDAVFISWSVYVAGTLLLLAHAGIAPRASMPWPTPSMPWLLVLFSGVAATALGNLAWNAAIGRIGVARTAVFLYWVPVFGVAFAAVLLDEPLTPWHLAGFALVMSGTYLGTHASRAAVPGTTLSPRQPA